MIRVASSLPYHGGASGHPALSPASHDPLCEEIGAPREGGGEGGPTCPETHTPTPPNTPVPEAQRQRARSLLDALAALAACWQ